MNKSTTRLDGYIAQKYPVYSRSTIQKLIKTGYVTIEGSIETRVSRLVRSQERVELQTQVLEAEYQEQDLTVLYEDENCVVADKPIGVLTHSKGVFNPEPTVASWLKTRPNYAFPLDADRGGIVHRLDRATSGVIICAKNKPSLGMLQKQFQLRKAKKVYIARVKGVPEPAHALLDLPIERNPKKPQTFRVGANGKDAQTEYKILQEFEKSSLLELKPRSGRTHQLRVHLTYIKHPIVGDVLYGGEKADRLFLHANSLEITIPGGIRKTFSSKTPVDFEIA